MSVYFPPASEEDVLVRKLRVLSDEVWRLPLTEPEIHLWLQNFSGRTATTADERLNALYLLSQFTYFGQREVRVMLRSMYRDLFAYPIVQEVRSRLGGTRDANVVDAGFKQELQRSRFLAMGNPSESGSHLLYFFRQENALSRTLFVNQHEIFSGPVSDPATVFVPGDLKRIVFIDDLLGSGQQSASYSRTFLRDVRKVAQQSQQAVSVAYYVLFAKPAGLAFARGPQTLFDSVEAVHELEEFEAAFSASARIYQAAPHGVTKYRGELLASTYGERLWPSNGLGYRDGQMLLGFYHNVPDNTLPIFWSDEPGWTPIFHRYPKVYG